MTNNFNPGFDREKAAFLELANRGEGLTPIEYIYAGNASFESVLASYLKGGMIDINMLYVTNIDAKDIITVTLEADIGTITTIYSENIYNKEKITTKDLFVSSDITVGTVSSLASATFRTKDFLIAGIATSFALATFDVVSGFESHDIATLFSLVSPAISINAPAISINYVEGALKVGAVGIYSGGLIDINAPRIQIGDPTKLGVRTLDILMKPDLSFTCASATINLTGSAIINLTSEADINLKSPTIDLATEFIEVGGLTEVDYTTIFAVRANKFFVTTQSLATMEIQDTGVGTNFSLDGIDLCDISANKAIINVTSATTVTTAALDINCTDVNINSSTVNITGTGNVSLKAAGIISLDSPGTIPGVPVPVAGGGALVADFIPPLPVSGELVFTLPNVVTCEDGKLITVDYIVTLTCVI
jgi:hypothetical protein